MTTAGHQAAALLLARLVKRIAPSNIAAPALTSDFSAGPIVTMEASGRTVMVLSPPLCVRGGLDRCGAGGIHHRILRQQVQRRKTFAGPAQSHGDYATL